ncbi:MAG TPA: M56 family metallopeptidase, partial [Verrucomicrobiales bacterium]|nr:M56 family metallopeptidase [Verrucomicrobiales bacterium]
MTWSWLGMEPELPADPDRKSNTVFATAQDASSGGLSEGSSNRPLPTARETSLPTSSLLSENLVILKPWAVWITPFWAIGAILMLIHTFRTTLVVSRIRNEAVSLCDRTLDLINDEFRQALRIARPVTIQLSQEILSPAVMGILKPVILFPASMLNHLPTEQMKAILAHELAHIRRNDYLVNLVQRVIESLFYFNPFVWLINRQIRNEREACCDAVAVKLTGERESYAETLISVTQFLNNSNLPADALPAFSGNAKPSGLIDRFKRLLDPQYQPRLGLRLSGLLTTLPVVGLLLFGLHKGSDQAVAFAAKFLTDKERVAAIQTLQKDAPTPLIPGDMENYPKVRVTGKVIMEDGSPIPEDK